MNVLRKILFKIVRITLFVLSFLTLVFQIWMISWMIYNEVQAKKLRKDLANEFESCVSKNSQKELNKLQSIYLKKQQNFEKESSEMFEKAKTSWFAFQMLRQKGYVLRTQALEHSFYVENIKNIDLKNYFKLKEIKRTYA